MTPNRIVVLLTPIFVAVSGLIAGWVADILPGVKLDEAELTAVFIAAALAATTAVAQWLHGWQKHEEREALLEPGVEPALEEPVDPNEPIAPEEDFDETTPLPEPPTSADHE